MAPRLFLLLLTFSLCGILAAPCAAQGPVKDKEPVMKEKAPEPAKAPPTIDQLKISPGTVLVIVDELKDVLALIPRAILLRPEEYQEMKDRIKALEKLLKVDRKGVSVCKLNGRLDGDTVSLRGEFFFSTEAPRTTVFLGMQGGVLTEEGELDKGPPHLEAVEDGYVARVEKPGNHHLVVHLVVPVGLKRFGLGGSAERTLEMGLPGSAVTTLQLELPPGVKEIRWNDRPEKRKGGRWDLTLGKEKNLALSWKEPVHRPESEPLQTIEAQITLKVEEKQLSWNADLSLEDLQGQTQEWHLLLPPEAKAELKTAGASGGKLRAVEGKPYTHVLELKEKGTERWVVNVQYSQPRPEPGVLVPVGPFHISGAARQQGIITIQASPEAMRGQRLIFHRQGDTLQREPPRTGSVLATFQYWSLIPVGKGRKGPVASPLLLEWKNDPGKGEALVDHQLRMQRSLGGRTLELTTRIQLKVGPPGLRFFHIQVPRPSAVPTGAFIGSGLPFPAGVPWPEVFSEWADPDEARPVHFSIEGDGGLVRWEALDSQGRIKVEFLGGGEDLPTVVVQGRYQLPRDPGPLHVPLPRPLGVETLGSKVDVKAEEEIEFLWQKPGQAEPASALQHFQETWKGPLEALEFSWRDHKPQLPASAKVHVDLLDRKAEVMVHLRFAPLAKKGPPLGEGIALVYPPGVDEKKVIREDKGPGEVILKYEVPLRRPAEGEGAARHFSLSFPWPKGATQKKVHLQVWADGGLVVDLDETDPSSEGWGEAEEEGKGYPPSLALFHPGPEPALNLILRPDKSPHLRVDRALMRVKVDAQGNHEYRAQYLVRSIHVRLLRLRLPVNSASLLEKEEVLLDGSPLKTSPDDRDWDLIRFPVERKYFKVPVVLEVRFKVRASEREGKWAWGTTFTPPQWAGPVVLGRVRWLVTMPGSRFALPAGINVQPVYSWGLVGWLVGPTPSSSSSDLEAWVTNRNPTEPEEPVSLVLEQPELEAVSVLHFARPVWLLLCSGVVLLFGLSFLLLSFPRKAFWLLVFLLLGGAVVLAWFWPSLLVGLAYGCQPGLVVLLLLVLVQWLLQQSYRRQVVFLPGFTRLKTNSSLTRPASRKSEREPSTVDAPTPSGVGKPSTSHGT